MEKIKCIIIDDEPPAIMLIEKYCSMVEQLDIVGTYQNAIKAFNEYEPKTADLIFLDIQMPVLNGLDFLKSLNDPPSVIVTTAYRDYAVEGYDLDIIDYLLKPISFDRFLKAIARFRQKNSDTSSTQTKTNSEEQKEFIFFNINKKHHKVILEDIVYLESLKDYVRIHSKDGELVVKGNLGSTMKMLPEDRFIRIHRSFAIAIDSVKAFNQRFVDVNGKSLPVGESYREKFIQRIT